MTDFATRNSWYKSPIYVSCLVDHNLLKTLITIPFFMVVCSSNWPRLFCLQKLQIALDRSPRQRAAISEMMGAMVWHLAKYSLAWFLSTYLSWQMVMTPGKMEIFPQQATDVRELRAHNREAWLGKKDQDDVANPRSGFLLEGDVAHVKGHLGAVLSRPVIL